jgi:hypothetical protein
MVTEAHRLLSTLPGPLSFVTIAHPKWKLPVRNLDEANINAVRQWLYRRFKKLDTSVIAVGGFEVSLNVELDGTSRWAGHIHMVVAGSDKPSLRKCRSNITIGPDLFHVQLTFEMWTTSDGGSATH